MRELTKREIDQFCKTVIYHLIDAYDTDAFCETPGMSIEQQYKILNRMKEYAKKFETKHIRGNTTNTILDSILKGDLK